MILLEELVERYIDSLLYRHTYINYRCVYFNAVYSFIQALSNQTTKYMINVIRLEYEAIKLICEYDKEVITWMI